MSVSSQSASLQCQGCIGYQVRSSAQQFSRCIACGGMHAHYTILAWTLVPVPTMQQSPPSASCLPDMMRRQYVATCHLMRHGMRHATVHRPLSQVTELNKGLLCLSHAGSDLSSLGMRDKALFTLASQAMETVVGLAVIRIMTAKALDNAPPPTSQSDALFNFSLKVSCDCL